MTFSILTACYNSEATIGQAIASLRSQSFGDYEHLIQDGGSRDATMEIVRRTADHRTRARSERDSGLYDALNRALARATGEIVGLLHSDDYFAAESVLERVAAAFSDPGVDAVYGDLHYVAKENPERIVRNWQSEPFRPGALATGWMPPHPALFLRRSVIERHGGYDTRFAIAADYDAILRYFSQPGFTAVHIPLVVTKMRMGGISNRSLGFVLRKSREDYLALRKNRIGGAATLARKNLSKLRQFF